MRITTLQLEQIILSGGLDVSPLGVLRLALDLRDARQAMAQTLADIEASGEPRRAVVIVKKGLGL